MKFKLEIECDNAAFEPHPTYEIARILRRLADDIDGAPATALELAGWIGPKLRDISGNQVGQAKVTK